MVLTILATLLIAIPLIDRGRELSVADRRLLAAVGTAGFAFIFANLRGWL